VCVTMADMEAQPLDLSCPSKFWLAAPAAAAASPSARDLSVSAKMTAAAAASAYAKLSVAIPRRYSNCSDNVSFADSDRSPSISPASDRLGSDRLPQNQEDSLNHHHRLNHSHHHLSDSELSSSLGSDSEGDPSPGPRPLVTRVGPATKRFLSKYIKEQVGK
jgi:hypothetical protein